MTREELIAWGFKRYPDQGNDVFAAPWSTDGRYVSISALDAGLMREWVEERIRSEIAKERAAIDEHITAATQSIIWGRTSR